MEFKSQIATNVEQSKRLLELGLKKETADMKHIPYSGYAVPKYFDDGFGFEDAEYIPAWSLHRLMEVMYNGDIFSFVNLTTHDRNIDTIYELAIANIEGLIKIDKFNQDYLEEEK